MAVGIKFMQFRARVTNQFYLPFFFSFWGAEELGGDGGDIIMSLTGVCPAANIHRTLPLPIPFRIRQKRKLYICSSLSYVPL